jgi:hypothetical protein
VQDVYYVPSLLTKFMHYANDRLERSEARHDLERQRLESVLEAVTNDTSKDVLTKTVEQNELSRLEERNVLGELMNFVNSVKGVMGSEQKKPESCAVLTCGEGATCTMMTDGATCKCDAGFVGDGFICKRPVSFQAKQLLPDFPSVQVGDVHVSEMKGTLLLVYHDKTDERGYAMVGKVEPASVAWSKPVAFSEGSVFSPQGALIPENRFVISYRDANTQGSGMVVGGLLEKGNSSGLVPVMGTPLAFSRMQSHQTSVVPLPGSRFAVLFCEHKADGLAFGSAMLGEVLETGAAEQLGVFPFAESAVTRLTATLLSPESFVVAYRAAPDPTADPLTVVRGEANVVYGKLTAADLVFDPHALALEPSKTEIWDRGLGLLTANRFQYTYQSGTDEKTVVAVVEVDKLTHRMHVTSKKEVAAGFSPFTRSIGLAFAPAAPRSFSFYEHNGVGKYTTCSLNPTGSLVDCVEKTWLSKSVTSVSSLALGEKRVLFVFAGKDGVPYYQVAALV